MNPHQTNTIVGLARRISSHLEEISNTVRQSAVDASRRATLKVTSPSSFGNPSDEESILAHELHLSPAAAKELIACGFAADRWQKRQFWLGCFSALAAVLSLFFRLPASRVYGSDRGGDEETD